MRCHILIGSLVLLALGWLFLVTNDIAGDPQKITLADADQPAPLRTLSPANAQYSGQQVNAVYKWPHTSFDWHDATFWITDRGLYRRFEDGTIRQYDPRSLTERVMHHRTETPERGYVSLMFRNVVVSGDAFWLASNGFGVFRYYPENELWTRFDNTARYVHGKHMRIMHADDSYVFVAAGWGKQVPVFNVFSQNSGQWAAVAKIPEEYVISLGVPAERDGDGRLVAGRRDYRSFLRDGFFEVPASPATIKARGEDYYVYTDEKTDPITQVLLLRTYLDSLFVKTLADEEPPTTETAPPVELSWVDEKTGEVLFTVADIVRFDWERQLFELEHTCSMNLSAWLHTHMRQFRGFVVQDAEGIIYHGRFYSPLSSVGYGGPAIYSEIGKPARRFFQIHAGYPVGSKDDQTRFAPRLLAALQKANVLGEITDEDEMAPGQVGQR